MEMGRSMLDELQGRGLILHHWDADGICTARLLLERMRGRHVDNRTPRIGRYHLTEEELEEFSGYDFVVVADMALPEGDVLRLAEGAEVVIFDHHLGPEIGAVVHHNPVIKGAAPGEYPSASWVVNEYLGNEVNLHALLGVVGDREERIRDNPVLWPIISGYCRRNGLEFEEMLRMAHLLDSSYKVGDREAVEEAPRLLLGYGGPGDILDNPRWNGSLRILDDEIRRQLDAPPEEVRGVAVKRMDTGYNIISTVARRLAWEGGRDAVVVNTGLFEDADQVYARSGSRDMGPIIGRGRALGLRAGGKGDVLGAVVPKEKMEAFLKEIIDFLSDH